MGRRRAMNRQRAYTKDKMGTKTIPVSEETMELLKKQQAAFRHKFGREPAK